ncbi:hypothetical protein M3P05_00780 [Sansalvadorimonas sp. 2012CJ34-2]|uniref:Transmembrane protein n=1 Tax=Parendozoicomonas callyspongiae TaxID=2942213 RepID=A0ABT0PAU0_9GAMM|nr:hypothetical protein [Sansalvadorimonas sp. 2012CJ34-2]MCL6268485.1 hypothetical protein [Sansalvadorimonas sp. 2012CJ34-2]
MTVQAMAPASRNRLPLIMIFLIPFGGMGLAAWMYFSGQMIPDSRNHQGNLIWPPVPVAEFQWSEQRGGIFSSQKLDEQWGVVVVPDGACGSVCRETLFKTRQAHIALGRRAERLSRYLVLSEQGSERLTVFLDDEHQGIELLKGKMPKINNHPNDSVRVFVIDPLGNVMLWFNQEHSGKQILKDLEKLLKNSRIG